MGDASGIKNYSATLTSRNLAKTGLWLFSQDWPMAVKLRLIRGCFSADEWRALPHGPVSMATPVDVPGAAPLQDCQGQALLLPACWMRALFLPQFRYVPTPAATETRNLCIG